MEYPPVKDGEWIRPPMKGYLIACCDCCLVHKFNFKVIDKNDREIKGARVIVQAFRSETKTKLLRKKHKK
jgi:hypothetical protein